MLIDLGRIQLPKAEAIKRLKQDLRDDWFPDALRFEDMIESNILVDYVGKNFEFNHGRFSPSERHVCNIPKANFTLRYALETGLPDRFLYHAVVSHLIPFFDPLIPWNAFSHRIDPGRSNEKSIFKNGVRAWQDFVGNVRSSITPSDFLLSTDLSNFYECINLKSLHERLISLIPKVAATATQKSELRSYIAILFEWLNSWAYDSEKGLPQNRDASSFLANIYMHAVDVSMISRGYRYFRYMDDIKIVCKSEFEARKALKELSLALREIGASINSKKTTIISGGDSENIESCLDAVSCEIGLIDAMWRTRRPQILTRSFPLLKEFTIKLIESQRTELREFRYCIKRLETLALCEEFKVPSAFFAEITPFIIDGLPKFPASTDQFVRYLSAVPLSNTDMEKIVDFICNPQQTIYSWQNFRVWQLLALKKFRSPKALKYSKKIISMQSDNPTRSGASLYLGTIGNRKEREFIARRFKDLKSFQGQRSALIAIHELKYRPIVEDNVKEHLRDDLQNVFRYLQTTRKGSYHLPPEKIPLSRIANVDVSYE